MNFATVEHLAEEHPVATGAIVVGAGLGVMWLLGMFGGGAAGGGTSLDQAYYQAEAVQSQANSAVQIATLQTTAQTAQAKIGADAATSQVQAQVAGATAQNAASTAAAVAIAQSQGKTTLGVAKVQGRTQRAVATTAAGVAIAQSADALSASKAATQADLIAKQAQIASATTIATGQTAAQLQATLAGYDSADEIAADHLASDQAGYSAAISEAQIGADAAKTAAAYKANADTAVAAYGASVAQLQGQIEVAKMAQKGSIFNTALVEANNVYEQQFAATGNGGANPLEIAASTANMFGG